MEEDRNRLQRNGMRFHFLHFQVLIIVLFCSCNDNARDAANKKLNSLDSTFAKLRYEGAFRTDTVFQSELEKHYLNIRNLNPSVADSILLIKSEWQLFREMDMDINELLSSVDQEKHRNEIRWLNAFDLVNKGESVEASALLRAIINNSSKNSRSLLLKTNWLLGSISEENEMDSSAMEYYTRAVTIGPVDRLADYYVESLVHKGNLKYMSGQIEEARDHYSQGLNTSIDHQIKRLIPACYYHLGKVYEHTGDQENAKESYKKGLASAEDLGQNGAFMQEILRSKILTKQQ